MTHPDFELREQAARGLPKFTPAHLVPCKCEHHAAVHTHEHPGKMSPAFACDDCECQSYRPDFEAVK